jgi:hypothetical protein
MDDFVCFLNGGNGIIHLDVRIQLMSTIRPSFQDLRNQ